MQTIPGIWFPKIFECTRQQPRLKQVPRLHKLSLAGFQQDYAKASAPFILTTNKPLLAQSVILLRLRQELKDYPVSVRFGDMANVNQYLTRQTAMLTMGEFLNSYFLPQEVEQTGYVGSSEVDSTFLEALQIAYPPYYPADYFTNPRLWFGKKGTATPLHKDIPDNFALNCFGTKKWFIYPPRDFPFLYMSNPTPEAFPDYGVSAVAMHAPDLNQFPEFVHAQGLEFLLQPGEMLYLPAGWSHQVENIEESLMVNFWLLRDKSPAVLRMREELPTP